MRVRYSTTSWREVSRPSASAFWISGMPVSTTVNGLPLPKTPAQPVVIRATVTARTTSRERVIVRSPCLRVGTTRRDHGLRAAAGRGVGEGLLDLRQGKAGGDEAFHAELRHEGQGALEGGPAAERAVDTDLAEVDVEEVERQARVLGIHADELQHAG